MEWPGVDGFALLGAFGLTFLIVPFPNFSKNCLMPEKYSIQKIHSAENLIQYKNQKQIGKNNNTDPNIPQTN